MENIKIKVFLLINVLFLFSCSQQQKQERPNTFAPKVLETKGYVVPTDSVTEPKIILSGKPVIIKAGTPTVVPTNTNIVQAGQPKIILVGETKLITPGQDTFLLPKIVPAIDSPFLAGIPEIVIAKDAYVKDRNPESFSSLSKLQGLKHDNIICMLQDKSGNLWLGTYGGGVSKYDGRSFTHFTEKEGLSNNNVLSMLQDKSGNLWFGTVGGGVSKYDGKYFTHFTEKQGLSNNNVRSILEDKSGNLWFGTFGGGVSKYDGKSFTHFTKKQGLSNNTVVAMLEDKHGNLWFGTEGGISKYDGKSFAHFTIKNGLPSNSICSILEEKNENLWFGTDAGVCRYNGKSFSVFTEKEGLSNNIVLSMLEDKSGNLWFGTYIGICKYNPSAKLSTGAESFTHFTEKEGLSNNTIFSILEDKSGNLLFGTNGGGVAKYDGKSFTHFTEKEGLSNNTIWGILEDKSGNLWLATDGTGVSKYDGKSFTHFTEKEGLTNNTVLSMLEDKRGNLWLCTNFKGVSKYDGISFTHFTEKEGLLSNAVKSVLEDKNGNIWFGTNGGVSKYDGEYFTHFTEKEGLSNNNILSMLEDKNGNFWFGTNGGGVSKLTLSVVDGRTKYTFTHFTEKEGLSNNFVRSMLEDKSGILWFGTNGGVSKYDPSAKLRTGSESFTHFTEKEGLANNTVSSILEDKAGNLWFGSRFGLSKLSAANKVKLLAMCEAPNNINTYKDAEGKIFFKNYTYEDGFLGIGVNRGKTIYEDKNGTIWVAANDRLTAYHPKGELEDTLGPDIQLTNIALFNENISWVNLEHKKDTTIVLGNGVSVGDFEFDGLTPWYCLPQNLSLKFNNNYLTFNFIGITQKQSKKVKYQYKLEGIDENWSAITSRTEAAYGNIPEGNYLFKVKAINSEGYWSKEFNYTFSIRPPWWKTWWMYALYSIVIIASVVLIVWWNGRRLRARATELTEEVRRATVTIVEQKKVVEEKSIKLEEAFKNITDSINYALRIQQAFLPLKKEIYASLPQSFILFKPKDIVSGDFYFFHKNEESVIIAAVDCTGHGVPGAFMSMVGSERLTDAVQLSNNTSEILSLLNKGVKTSLKQSNKDESTKDGMDIALCSINTKQLIVNYAGANRPLWIIRKGKTEIEEIKPTKTAIGGFTQDNHYFETHEVKLQQGDTFYIFTDGYADQFGGLKGKKLMTKKLKEILLSIQHKSMQEQEQHLNSFIDNWKAGTEQVDDILVIGIRV